MKRALVTGGGGFLGSAILRLLREEGGWELRSFSRGAYPDLEAAGIECFRGDLADLEAVEAAVAGSDIVFHVGAKAGVWGKFNEYYEANVRGTEHILAACRKHGVSRLVYTSSPSVVHGGEAIEGGDESLPYPDHFEAPYPETKATAEKMVLAADSGNLATTALRPHLIWGPGDNHLVPKIIERARKGRLRLVGKGDALIDTVYIDNAAEAHLAAARTLEPGAACAGRAYFITNGEPRSVREIINGILKAGGLPPIQKTVPMGVAVTAGKLLELAHSVFAPGSEPAMTSFLARQLGTAHYFDISAARRDLGWTPRISLDEGFDLLRQYLQTHTP